nr:MAG: hypothetical protein DIU56_05535 [Pseudomonadota bacterium]
MRAGAARCGEPRRIGAIGARTHRTLELREAPLARRRIGDLRRRTCITGLPRRRIGGRIGRLRRRANPREPASA